jgi:CheY-like chemotaxis protein
MSDTHNEENSGTDVAQASGEVVPSILVVDDNPLIVDVLKGLLRSQNYKVFTSNNGKEALDVLQQKKVDVIICDVMMPKMGGYELHEAVRAAPECSHIPFVFLTALDDKSEIERGKEIGADDYICKPFEPRELLAIVKGKVSRAMSLKAMSEKRYDNYRRRVIHTLSHEFRTPLVAINTGMELLLEHQTSLDSSKAKNLLDAVRRGGLRLEKLVNDFMVLQQMDAGVPRRFFETRATPMPVKTLIDRYMMAKSATFVSQGVEFKLTDDTDGAAVKVVESQMVECLDRLVSNAVKFSPSDRTVEIHTYKSDDEICIDVKDRGIGLDLDKLDEAIDVFGQIDRDRLEQQGGGLGLPIASRYAAINNGRLEFEPRREGGSIVSIVLPLFTSVP